MARFNETETDERVLNEAGGLGFQKSAKLELALLALTSFVKDGFYRSANSTLERMTQLVPQVGTEFAAKAAIHVRTKAHMRSISHAIAAQVAKASKGEPWLRAFFRNVVVRPDDVLEILAAWSGGKPIRKMPCAMKRGLADALSGFDSYALAKYRGEGKRISLIDAVRLLHPRATERNAEAFQKLVAGELVADATWEANLTRAGQGAAALAEETGKTREEAALELKAAAWADLIGRRKLGYMAMLRNLRNIAEQAPDCMPQVLEDLQNPELVRKSKQLPFRFMSAYEAFSSTTVKQPAMADRVMEALTQALQISCEAMPRFPGRTLVALDGSGSMMGGNGGFVHNARQPASASTTWSTPWRIGCLFAAAILNRNLEADLVIWSMGVKPLNVGPRNMPLVATAKMIDAAYTSGGTDLGSCFRWMRQRLASGVKYDRVIVLSDQEAWAGDTLSARREYARATGGALPRWWAFDLTGNPTLQIKEQESFVVGGYSDQVIQLMSQVEENPTALVDQIESVQLMEERGGGDAAKEGSGSRA